MTLGGCTFGDPFSAGGSGKGKTKSVSVVSSFTLAGTVQPGTQFTPGAPNTVNVANQVTKGTFSGTLPFKVNPALPKGKKKKASAAGGGISAVSGSFVSRLGGTYNFVAGTGTFTGVQVLRFSQSNLGDACLSVTSTASNFGKNETGTWTLDGGTKLSARTRGTGSYTASKPAQGISPSVTGSANVSLKIGKPAKPLSADCATLAGQL